MSLRLALGLTLIGLSGCQPSVPTLVPVTGRVFHRGLPLAGGLIVFVPDPDRGNSGELARARIGPDGSYYLITGDRVGAPPGWHRVAIAPAPATRAGTAVLELYREPPKRYRNPQLSGLLREVRAGAANVFDFHLDDS